MFTSVKNIEEKLPSEFKSVSIKNTTEKTFQLFPMVASEFLVCYLCYLSFIQEQDTGNDIIKLAAFVNTFFFYHFSHFDLCVTHRQCSVQLQPLAGEVLRTSMECKAAKTHHVASHLHFFFLKKFHQVCQTLFFTPETILIPSYQLVCFQMFCDLILY